MRGCFGGPPLASSGARDASVYGNSGSNPKLSTGSTTDPLSPLPLGSDQPATLLTIMDPINPSGAHAHYLKGEKNVILLSPNSKNKSSSSASYLAAFAGSPTILMSSLKKRSLGLLNSAGSSMKKRGTSTTSRVRGSKHSDALFGADDATAVPSAGVDVLPNATAAAAEQEQQLQKKAGKKILQKLFPKMNLAGRMSRTTVGKNLETAAKTKPVVVDKVSASSEFDPRGSSNCNYDHVGREQAGGGSGAAVSNDQLYQRDPSGLLRDVSSNPNNPPSPRIISSLRDPSRSDSLDMISSPGGIKRNLNRELLSGGGIMSEENMLAVENADKESFYVSAKSSAELGDNIATLGFSGGCSASRSPDLLQSADIAIADQAGHQRSVTVTGAPPTKCSAGADFFSAGGGGESEDGHHALIEEGMQRSATIAAENTCARFEADVRAGMDRGSNFAQLRPHATESRRSSLSSRASRKRSPADVQFESLNSARKIGTSPTYSPANPRAFMPCTRFIESHFRFNDFTSSHLHTEQKRREIDVAFAPGAAPGSTAGKTGAERRAKLVEFMDAIAAGDLRELMVTKLMTRLGVAEEPPTSENTDPFTLQAYAERLEQGKKIAGSNSGGAGSSSPGKMSTNFLLPHQRRRSSLARLAARLRRGSSLLYTASGGPPPGALGGPSSSRDNNSSTIARAVSSVSTGEYPKGRISRSGDMLNIPIFGKSGSVETLNKLILQYLYEVHNGPDLVCFIMLRYCNWDVKKALEHLARVIVWYNCDLWRDGGASGTTTTSSSSCSTANANASTCTASGSSAVFPRDREVLLMGPEHQLLEPCLPKYVRQCGAAGEQMLPLHLQAEDKLEHVRDDEEAIIDGFLDKDCAGAAADIDMGGGPRSLSQRKHQKSVGCQTFRAAVEITAGQRNKSVAVVGEGGTPAAGAAAGTPNAKKKLKGHSPEEYKIDLDFGFDASPEKNRELKKITSPCREDVAALAVKKRVPTAEMGVNTETSFPALHPIVNAETPEPLARILSPLPPNFSPYHIRERFDQMCDSKHWACLGPPYKFSDKVFLSKYNDSVELCRFAPVLGMFAAKSELQNQCPMLHNQSPADMCRAFLAMKLRKIQHLKEFGCAGSIFLLDCRGASLYQMMKTTKNAQIYQKMVWEFMRNLPGGMNRSLLYNMSAATITCLTMATMMWCKDDRDRIKTCTGRPSKKQLEDMGISEDMFKEMEEELDSGGSVDGLKAGEYLKKEGKTEAEGPLKGRRTI